MSTAKPVFRYPVPELKDLPDDIREKILAVQEKAGFVPNVVTVPAGARSCDDASADRGGGRRA